MKRSCSAVGLTALESITTVPTQDLHQQLLALDNDGSFLDVAEIDED